MLASVTCGLQGGDGIQTLLRTAANMGGIEKFGHFEIARGADGQPVELPRSPEEFVFLAFDTRIKRLVELHVLKSGERLRAADKRSASERAQLAAGVRSNSFIRILECGEEEDVVFYSSGLNDGEPLDAYIARRGALSSPTAFSLVMQLLDDLIVLQQTPRLLSEVRLDKIFITLQEETFLQLRVLDFGLSNRDQRGAAEEVQRRLVCEMCAVIFLMLTGKAYAGDDCDRYPVLTGLPTGLRAALRSSLANPENAPASIQRLREEVRDALMAQTRDLHGRSSRRHLVASDQMLPQSALRDVLMHEVRIEQLLKGRLVPEGGEGHQRYPFTFQAADARTEAPVTVHVLPPRRIVSNEHYDAVPLQMWRFNAEKHPNILRSLSVWESPDLTFLTEERAPGFPLSRLIAERVHLNPPEVLIIMRQVKRGIDQALECGVEKLDLHPCNIMLRVGGGTHAREMDKLLQKRLDAWPKFLVMLRPHMTMRSLYEPLLVDAGRPDSEDEFFEAKDFRNRSYVALASYLLSGERQLAGQVHLPDSVPNDLALFITQCVERCHQPGKAPSPQEFLAEFEKRTSVPEVETGEGGIAMPARRGAHRETVAVTEMESAGSVSDFDEDDREAGLQPATSRSISVKPLLGQPSVKIGESRVPVKGRLGLLLWGAVFLVLVFIVYALFSGGVTREQAGKAPPAASSGSITAPDPANPPINPDTGRPMTPEEIRRALLPSEREKEELRKRQPPAPKPAGASLGTPLHPPGCGGQSRVVPAFARLARFVRGAIVTSAHISRLVDEESLDAKARIC